MRDLSPETPEERAEVDLDAKTVQREGGSGLSNVDLTIGGLILDRLSELRDTAKDERRDALVWRDEDRDARRYVPLVLVALLIGVAILDLEVVAVALAFLVAMAT